MSNTSRQVSLPLNSQRRYGLEYLVTHSGIVEAQQALNQALSSFLTDSSSFYFIYIFGPEGSGKTHLAAVFQERASSLGIASEQIAVYEDLFRNEQCSEEIVGQFVADYQRLKASGGIFLTTAAVPPRILPTDSHVISRCLSGMVVELQYPALSELRPVVISLLERENLRLSDKQITDILRLLPGNPLSCKEILAKVSEAALSVSARSTYRVISELLKKIIGIKLSLHFLFVCVIDKE